MGEDDAGPRPGRTPARSTCVCDGLPTLVWMAQLAAIELHPSLSLARAPKRPTVLAFDLDPGPPANIVDCAGWRSAARHVRPLRRRVLSQDLGLQGPAGLRAAQPRDGYEITKPFAKAIASCSRSRPGQGRLEDEEGRTRGQGLRRLVPEPPAEDDDRRLLAAGPRAPDRLDPGHLGGGRGGSPTRGDGSSVGLRGRARCWRGSSAHGDLFAPVLELQQSLPEL